MFAYRIRRMIWSVRWGTPVPGADFHRFGAQYKNHFGTPSLLNTYKQAD